jgi:hypothetical protein
MLRYVTGSAMSGTDLDDVLLAVEKAAPVDALEAVTRTIGRHLDADWVSFWPRRSSGDCCLGRSPEADSFTLSAWLDRRPASVGIPSTTASPATCCI